MRKLWFEPIFGSWNYVSALCAEQSLHGSLQCAEKSLHCYHPCAEQSLQICSAHGWEQCRLCSAHGRETCRLFSAHGAETLFQGPNNSYNYNFCQFQKGIIGNHQYLRSLTAPCDHLCCTLRSWVQQIVMQFRTFSPQLEDNDTLKCSSDSFPHWPHISGCVQNCQNYISMYHCSPIAERRSWKSVPNLSHIYVLMLYFLQTIYLQC